VDRPHRRVDPAVAVGDAKEACFTPCRAPAVLADPAALGVVISADRDAMAALNLAGHLLVDATAIGEEIGIDRKAAGHRPLGGDPGFHVGRRAEWLPCRDLDGATGPVGTLTTCLLVIGVGEAGLVRHAV